MLPGVSHYLVYAGLLASNADVTQEHNSSSTSASIACCHVNNRHLPAAVGLLVAAPAGSEYYQLIHESYQPAVLLTNCPSAEQWSMRIPTIITDRSHCRPANLRNLLSTTCHFRSRDNCLVRVPLEDSRLPSVLLTNVCHLQNKLDDLSVLIKQYCPEIICIAESTLPLVFSWAPTSVSLTNVHVERRSTPKGYTDCRAKADLAGLCAIMLLTI